MKYFLVLLTLFSTNAFSSSCCGGGSSSSLIITGDNRAEMSLGYSLRNDIGQTNQDGWSTLNSDKIKDQKQIVSVQGQYQVSEFGQVATKLTLVNKILRKSGLDESEIGLGDVDLQGTYEYLPEYTFSNYKPRGFVYSKISIPTSKSLYNSESSIFTDVRGTGLYSLSLGNFFLKRLDNITLKCTTEWTHYLGKTYSQFKLHDYEKFVFPLGIAYSPPESNFTLGLTDTFSYQMGKTLTGNINSKSTQEYFWELNTFVNYSPNRNEIWSLSYSDSTLQGKNINSPLYRSGALNYTYVFEL
jgi:hypothetical protein